MVRTPLDLRRNCEAQSVSSARPIDYSTEQDLVPETIDNPLVLQIAPCVRLHQSMPPASSQPCLLAPVRHQYRPSTSRTGTRRRRLGPPGTSQESSGAPLDRRAVAGGPGPPFLVRCRDRGSSVEVDAAVMDMLFRVESRRGALSLVISSSSLPWW